jgi:hypothetical protein
MTAAFPLGILEMATSTSRHAAKRRAPRASAGSAARKPGFPNYSRGNALTPTVNFVDRDHTSWLVYIEPGPAEPALWPNAALIPGRRLRFDSVEQSVTVTGSIPAGAPYLGDARLQALLDEAEPLDEALEPVSVPMPADQRRDWISTLSRMVQPAALTLIVLKDALLSRTRG